MSRHAGRCSAEGAGTAGTVARVPEPKPAARSETSMSIPLPGRSFRVTFLPAGRTVEVNPQDLPYGHCGLPGSLLDIALGHGIDIEHACGGVCACSTCHVLVRQGIESCCAPTEKEQDQLDLVPGLRPTSRLACQCVPDGTSDIVAELPAWNRNAAREREK